MNKTINTRIQHKHDIESNWNRATEFIPMQGEIIIYDADESYSYERFKIGDGKTLIINLPFYLEHEIESALERINFLANNTLKAECQNGILVLNKGVLVS